MAAAAAREALERAGLSPEDVDLIVVSTGRPSTTYRPRASFVQEKLGLRSCAAVDIRSGCAGAVEALDFADFQVDQGDYETAVVIGTEAISPLIVPLFLEGGPDSVHLRDRLGIYSSATAPARSSCRPASPETGASSVPRRSRASAATESRGCR